MGGAGSNKMNQFAAAGRKRGSVLRGLYSRAGARTPPQRRGHEGKRLVLARGRTHAAYTKRAPTKAGSERQADAGGATACRANPPPPARRHRPIRRRRHAAIVPSLAARAPGRPRGPDPPASARSARRGTQADEARTENGGTSTQTGGGPEGEGRHRLAERECTLGAGLRVKELYISIYRNTHKQ